MAAIVQGSLIFQFDNIPFQYRHNALAKLRLDVGFDKIIVMNPFICIAANQYNIEGFEGVNANDGLSRGIAKEK